MLSYWFGQAMEAAIITNDLPMIKLIHALHPEPLAVYSLRLVMEHGTLDVVQWVVGHRRDRLCCSPGIENLCDACLSLGDLGGRDPIRIVEWLATNGIEVTTDKRSPIVPALTRGVAFTRYIYERGLLGQDMGDKVLWRVIHSYGVDVLAVVQYLMARGFTVTKEALVGALVGGACDPRKAAVVEFLISSPRCDPIRHCFEYAATRPGGAKGLQWHGDATNDPTANASIIESIAREAFSRAHLDTLQWLHVARAAVPPSQSVHHPSTQENLLHFHEWRLHVGLTDWTGEDMGLAIHHGYLDVIQWLHSHSTIGFTTRAMDAAAANGHLTVVKWLHEHSAIGCTTAAMDNAASRGHLAVVQWLHRNRMDGCTKEAVSSAARGGHLEVVQWLCQN